MGRKFRHDDPTGRVAAGHIQLNGFPFRVTRLAKTRNFVFPEVETIGQYYLGLSLDDVAVESPSAEAYWFLPLRIRSKNSLSGLVLERTGGPPGEYRRVGLFIVSIVDGKLRLESLSVLHKLSSYRVRPLELGDYRTRTGRRKNGIYECTITIV